MMSLLDEHAYQTAMQNLKGYRVVSDTSRRQFIENYEKAKRDDPYIPGLIDIRKKVHDFHMVFIHTKNADNDACVDMAMNEIWNDLNAIINRSGYTEFKEGDVHCSDCPCRYGQHIWKEENNHG